MASMSSNHAHGVSVTYSYDDLNRLTTVVDTRLAGNQTTTYSYDNASNVGKVTYPNGIATSFTYDLLNRVTGLSSTSTPAASYTYQRGATGNLTQVVELSGRQVSWSYDGIYRLTQENIQDDQYGESGQVTYGLDPVGNRTSASSNVAGLSPVAGTTFGAGDPDDLLSGESYDANRNVIFTGGKSFTYDSENHMMSMTAAGTSVTMLYDGDGNRVAKTVTANGVPTTTYYLVDDLNPTGYPQVVEELAANGTVERQYTYGLQRIDEQQLISNAWTPSFYGYDGGGNVRQLTNAAGGVTDSYEYDAFGNSFQTSAPTSGPTPNNYLYRGEQYDPDLGLYYLRARYYNPATGRFMSRDPEDGNRFDPATLHKYLYASGDPINAVDPTGRADYIESVFTRTFVSAPLELGVEGLVRLVAGGFAELQRFSRVPSRHGLQPRRRPSRFRYGLSKRSQLFARRRQPSKEPKGQWNSFDLTRRT
jgi:RHS repeat-associated protein